MQRLFTNTEEEQRDRLNSFINLEASKSDEVKIASAFFKHDGISKSFFENKNVMLLVGLTGVTSIQELRNLLKIENISVRYYFDKFHPKIYLFSTGTVVVGSSNYTRSGLGLEEKSNLECNIASDDPEMYREVGDYFDNIWREAAVLRERHLDELEEYRKALDVHNSQSRKILEELRPILDYQPYKQDKELADIAWYDAFRDDFKELSDVYFKAVGGLSELPERLELDQFLSWIYEYHKEDPAGIIYSRDARGQTVIEYAKMFARDNRREALFDRVRHNALFTSDLLTKDKIEDFSEEDVRLLAHSVHSFDDRYIDVFVRENGLDQVKQSLLYLLFGNEDIKIRLTEILKGRYRLKHIQASRALEILGWGDNNYPIWNWRVSLAMSILGFNNFEREKSEGVNDRPTNKI